MATLNLGILAHVDAGKTSLTERLLYAAGVIDELGSVDAGSTQTDSLALERRRGITIKSAVVSFALGGVTVNLIDTPGHPDFIAEVERVLGVLDGAVLVVSAVEGVQAQTRVLMRDAAAAAHPDADLRQQDRPRAARRTSASCAALGEQARPRRWRWARSAARARARPPSRRSPATPCRGLLDGARRARRRAAGRLRGRRADAAGRRARAPRWRRRPGGRSCTRCSSARPSPARGWTPSPPAWRSCCPAARGDAGGPVAGTVFKVDRGDGGREDRLRAAVLGHRPACATACRSAADREGKVTAIRVFDGRRGRPAPAVPAGQIGKLWGLEDVRIGDAIGVARPAAGPRLRPADARDRRRAAPPRGPPRALRRALPARRAGSADRLPAGRRGAGARGLALRRGAEGGDRGDAGRRLRRRGRPSARRRRSASSGRSARAPRSRSSTRTRTRSWPRSGCGWSRAAGVDLRAGGRARLDAPGLLQGGRGDRARRRCGTGLHGWRVTDCRVTMTHSGYWPRQSHAHATFDKSMSSTAGDFRALTPLVLLARAGRGRHGGAASRCTASGSSCRRTRSARPCPCSGGWAPCPAPPVLGGATCVLEGELPAARVARARARSCPGSRAARACWRRLLAPPPVRGPAPAARLQRRTTRGAGGSRLR